MICVFWSLLVVLARCCLVAVVWSRPGVLPKAFAVSEALALLSTVYAVLRGRVDKSAVGCLLPVLHGTPLLFDLSQPSGSGMAAGFFLLLCPVQWVIRARMGFSCTVGVPVFVTLLERWPYCWVRHPLAAVEILCSACVATYAGGSYNHAVGVCAVFAALCCVEIEERFLFTLSQYRTYAARVRFQFLPGVW